MAAHGLYLVRMDVAHDHERTFNDVYDKEHVPNLRAVKGVRRPAGYRQASATEPRYMAAYELDGPRRPSTARRSRPPARPAAGRPRCARTR